MKILKISKQNLQNSVCIHWIIGQSDILDVQTKIHQVLQVKIVLFRSRVTAVQTNAFDKSSYYLFLRITATHYIT